MNNAQVTAFNAATGGITPQTLLLVIASIVALMLLLWLAWLCFSQFRSWQDGQGDAYGLIYYTTRGAVVALLLGFLIR